MPAFELLRNGTAIDVYKVTVEKQGKRALDRCTFETKRNQALSLGDDIKFRKTGATPVYLFGGKLVEIHEEYDGKTGVAYSYAKSFEEIRIYPPRYYVNRSPESIAQDLVTSLTSLQWGSSWSSGVTLDSYEAYGLLGDNIRLLAQIAGADFFTLVDSAGVAKFYFQPVGSTNLGVTLNLGGSSANAARIDYNSGEQEIVNAVEVFGKTLHSQNSFKWTVTSSAGPGYILFVHPSISRVVRWRGATLTEGIDYRDRPVFVWPDTIGGSQVAALELLGILSADYDNPGLLEVDYVIDMTPFAYAENSSSIAAWGRRQRAFIIDNVATEADLQNLANKIVSLMGSPRRSLVVRVPGIRTDIHDGGYLTVNDPYLGISAVNFVVRKVTYSWPEGYTELELGEYVPEIYDIERQIRVLTETASRSVYRTKQRNKQYYLYLSGSGSTFELVQSWKDTVPSSNTVYLADTDIFVSIQLDLVGSSTATLTQSDTGQVRIKPTTEPREYYFKGIPLHYSWLDNARLANASNQHTLRLRVYVRDVLGATWTQIAPPAGYSFSITVSNVRKLLPTMPGFRFVLWHRDAVNGTTFYWGQRNEASAGSALFNIGYELV